MGRPATQTSTAVAQDQQRLIRMVMRAQENRHRPRKLNAELIACLNRAIAILADTAAAAADPGPEKKRTGT